MLRDFDNLVFLNQKKIYYKALFYIFENRGYFRLWQKEAVREIK